MEAVDETFFQSSLLLFCNFMLGLIFVGGIAANFLVLLVFYRKPGLRTTANRFVINLMVINLVACLSLLPIAFVDNSVDSPDEYLCFAEEFSSVFCSSVIVYAVLLIAIDQYFAVVDPLHYHCIISSWKGCLMIASSWAFSAVLAFFGAVRPDFGIFHDGIFRRCGSDSGGVDEDQGTREAPETPRGLYRIIFTASYVAVAFAVPFALITFIYYRICAAASGNSRRTRTSILTSEDSSQALREKFQSETNEAEKPTDKTPEKADASGDRQERCSLPRGESHESSANPSFVVTRPSPPRPLLPGEAKGELKSAERDATGEVPKREESRTRGKVESEVPLLKPTLKNNSSYTKLSSLHIQFSNSTEKIGEVVVDSTERRHSNVSLTMPDPEFENISKTRSSSVQSNFYEIPSRSSSSTRSTATSIHIQSSRSSSLNSTCARHPPSRASSIRSTSSYIVHNIRHRISNASLFRYREEARAARISAMVIVMALFCWLPFFASFSLRSCASLGDSPLLSRYFDVLSVVSLLLSTVASPFLFAFRNRQIKKEIRKIFRFCPEDLIKRDCSKSFYGHNFSLNLKSQTVHLFSELNKKTGGKQEAIHAGP